MSGIKYTKCIEYLDKQKEETKTELNEVENLELIELIKKRIGFIKIPETRCDDCKHRQPSTALCQLNPSIVFHVGDSKTSSCDWWEPIN